MTSLLDLARSSPVVVCGNPRSGTRMHANVLNAHPEILITDEFHDVPRLQAIASDMRKNVLLKKFSRERALVHQSLLAKMVWASNTIDRLIEETRTVRVIGNKTPQVERRWEMLENVFRATPPRYVYCLRSAPKVLRSVKNLSNLRWSRDDVATNLQRYVASVRVMERMREAFPERVHVGVIDHKGDRANSAFFEPLFRFVGVALTDEVGAAIDGLGPQNTMEAVKAATGRAEAPAVELAEAERALIRDDRDYAEIAERYGL